MPNFDISLVSAQFWYDAFNIFLYCGAFAVAIGTIGSIKMGAIKERYSDERISANEAEAEVAKATAATANEHAKVLETDLVKARIDLEKEKTARLIIFKQLAPREITNEQTEKLAELIRGRVREVWVFALDDSETQMYAHSVMKALKRGGVRVHLMISPSSNFSAINVSGTSSIGLTIREVGSINKQEGEGYDLMNAFSLIGVFAGLVPGTTPLPGVNGVALFVGLKQPPFMQTPENIRGGTPPAFEELKGK